MPSKSFIEGLVIGSIGKSPDNIEAGRDGSLCRWTELSESWEMTVDYRCGFYLSELEHMETMLGHFASVRHILITGGGSIEISFGKEYISKDE